MYRQCVEWRTVPSTQVTRWMLGEPSLGAWLTRLEEKRDVELAVKTCRDNVDNVDKLTLSWVSTTVVVWG